MFREGSEVDAAKDVGAALDRDRDAIDLLAQYSIDGRCEMRFAIEPKLTRPHGDIQRRPSGATLAFVEIVEDADGVYLQAHLPEEFDRARVGVVSGLDLEPVRFVDAEYEERDGSPAVIDTDLVGERKEHGRWYPPGPLATLAAGTSRTRVW